MVENGEVVGRLRQLIRPDPLCFDPFNVSYTASRRRMSPAPDLLGVLAALWSAVAGPLVAHNAAFDMSVLRRALDQSAHRISGDGLLLYKGLLPSSHGRSIPPMRLTTSPALLASPLPTTTLKKTRALVLSSPLPCMPTTECAVSLRPAETVWVANWPPLPGGHCPCGGPHSTRASNDRRNKHHERSRLHSVGRVVGADAGSKLEQSPEVGC